MSFSLHDVPHSADLDPRFDESLMRIAAASGPVACVWQAPQGLVVPRTYLRSGTFESASQDFADQGWPVTVRHSGGGVVPQGPGILNVSLAYAVEGRPLDHSDAAYQQLCDVMAQAAGHVGIPTCTRAVEGSFCDGRFNLAHDTNGQARKVAGTAQLWRRQPGPDGTALQVVLVHGLLLVATDVVVATQKANELEEALGNARRYLPERAASLHTLTPGPVADAPRFVSEIAEALKKAIRAQRR